MFFFLDLISLNPSKETTLTQRIRPELAIQSHKLGLFMERCIKHRHGNMFKVNGLPWKIWNEKKTSWHILTIHWRSELYGLDVVLPLLRCPRIASSPASWVVTLCHKDSAVSRWLFFCFAASCGFFSASDGFGNASEKHGAIFSPEDFEDFGGHWINQKTAVQRLLFRGLVLDEASRTAPWSVLIILTSVI